MLDNPENAADAAADAAADTAANTPPEQRPVRPLAPLQLMPKPIPTPLTQAQASPQRQPRRGHGHVTLRDVASSAGVTAITVSRYLREPERVALETAERIRGALALTGYTPNKAAGGLASGNARVVAALLPNLANSIFAETAQGLSDRLQAAGLELLIASTGYSQEREEEQLRALLGWRPAAVVVTGRRHSAAARALLLAAQSGGTPVIEIWDCHAPDASTAPAGDPGFTQVGFDHDEVGVAMAEHLLAAGHRQLAYVDSGVAEDYRAHERGLAFAEHARAHGAVVRLLVAPVGDPFDAGRQVLAELLRNGATAAFGAAGALSQAPAAGTLPVTAAAFANDHLASGALLEARRQGVAIPGRLALLGFGDFALARQLEPALSSVALPRVEIGEHAALAVLAGLSRRAAPEGGNRVPARAVLPASSTRLSWAVLGRASTAASLATSTSATSVTSATVSACAEGCAEARAEARAKTLAPAAHSPSA